MRGMALSLVLPFFILMIFSQTAGAQEFTPTRMVPGCFGSDPDGEKRLNGALDRVTRFNDMFESESRKIVVGGHCWWHNLPQLGSAKQYWRGFYQSKNGWIFAKWLHDVDSRADGSDLFWSDEPFDTRYWRIKQGRQCGELQKSRFGECLMPINPEAAKAYMDWASRYGHQIPPYVYIPRQWKPQ